jgi:hypothetical protein
VALACTMLDLEGELISYLRIYGNTKESDLTEYGTRVSNLSTGKIKCVRERMVLEGKANRVVHNKLSPEAVYITRENCCLHELGTEIEAEVRNFRDKDKISEEAGRILTEVAVLAEKRIKKMFPDYGKKSRRLQHTGKT